jgi:hypothetical protein
MPPHYGRKVRSRTASVAAFGFTLFASGYVKQSVYPLIGQIYEGPCVYKFPYCLLSLQLGEYGATHYLYYFSQSLSLSVL